jgi:hypothetical protein
MIKAFINWLLSTVRRTPAVATVAETRQPKASPKRRTATEPDRTQAHYYLGDLLNQLDGYFADFDFLKKGDPETAATIEKLGCGVADGEQLLSVDLEPVFYTRMPSIGCAYLGRHDDPKNVSLRFVYFQKHHQPVNVQCSNGVIYSVGGVFGLKRPHLLQFHVSVAPDGTVKALKEMSPQSYTVGKSGRRNGGRKHIVRMEWSYPNSLEMLRAEYNRKNHATDTVDDCAKRLLGLICSAILGAEAGLNVRVRKGARTATFAIDMLRAPYFFADRDKTTEGRREKILHIVRPHTRVGKNGVAKTVKAHWRGARRFTWNGYDVMIGMPGKHLPSLMLDWTAESWEAADMAREGRDGMSLPDAAARIADAINNETVR